MRPRLLRETFYQEGRHFELADPADLGSDLICSGIVFNEMKGAYSSPDSIMYKAMQENLYPDNVYSCDSGGNPEEIPSLTYDQLKEFHRLFYSPSNSRFFLYGNFPLEEILEFLDSYLSQFTSVSIDSAIGLQQRWQAPRTVHGFYPAIDSQLDHKAVVNVGWMMMENTDYESVIIMRILSEALVGNSASPLRKALISSGFGEDLSPVTGIENDLRQIAFGVGLRGCDAKNAGEIEALIMNTLQKTADEGFDPQLIEGSLHQIEFRGKEIVRTQFPYSIVLLQRVFHSWLYDGDPLVNLKFPRTIEEIRKKWQSRPGLFQEMLRKWFLDNPHRLLSVLEPNPNFTDEKDVALKQQMAPSEIRDAAARARKNQGRSRSAQEDTG